ncbi:major facilitator superfamily protein [Neobacillus bataviensis LMG 21833]|uniref:Major facilitator superfamily protein n=1 Tax=Neobacillus bataviensis LMG 21833 TaxID=1117379 RepID=K6E9S7_9BACI|nr:major facilitator superfamily protein [Neobacillus bataviensis LMG 21833]
MDYIEQICPGPQEVKKGSAKEGEKSEISKQKWAIVSLSSIPLVMTLGNSILIPVLPSMEKKLSISSFQTSMILTVYSIVAIFLIPVAGYLSDHIGRKKVIIPSLIIAGMGGLIETSNTFGKVLSPWHFLIQPRCGLVLDLCVQSLIYLHYLQGPAI